MAEEEGQNTCLASPNVSLVILMANDGFLHALPSPLLRLGPQGCIDSFLKRLGKTQHLVTIGG